MSEKKVVERSVAIAFGIVCILLGVGLVGAFAYYMPIINDKDNTISSLNAQISQLRPIVTSLQNQVVSDNATITNLQNIATLNESAVLDNRTINGTTTELWGNSFKNAGYVWVRVFATADTTVEVTYSFQNLNYDSQVDVGTNGTAIFPILPSPLVTMKIGNSTTPMGTIANVTAIYYY